MSLRPIRDMTKPRRVRDGAGVDLDRVFSNHTTDQTDPFLLLDHLQNDDPDKPLAGFPWHPHRGIETITYLISGGVQHEDSLGNTGILKDGDVQWMTAGSGIIHQEMPAPGSSPLYHGFQLWANLPSAKKMIPPRYQDIPSQEIPEITEDDGCKARVITGEFWGKTGPVTGISTNPRYLDILVPPEGERNIKIPLEQNAFAYIFMGKGVFLGASSPQPVLTEYINRTNTTSPLLSHPAETRSLVLFDRGDEIRIRAGEEGMRFLLVSGQPLKEPVAWYGPIVMNTKEELEQAYDEFNKGTFLKTHQNQKE